MNMRRTLAIAAAALLLLSPLAAQRGGGSRSSGGFSSGSRSSSYGSFSQRSSPPPSRPSSPSYGSYSKPSSTPQAKPSSGYGSFGKSQPVAKPAPSPQAQAAWARTQQAASAAAASKASLAKFKAPAKPAPAPSVVTASPTFGRAIATTKPTYQTYTIKRHEYYRSYQPPVYVYNSAPRYGVWDAMFMWMMLDSMNHSMYYNHRNDADWAAWRADADRQAQTNAELKAKLAAMDAKVKELEAQKTPVDPAYMPPGVDPTVALAQDVAEKTLPHETPAQNPDADEDPAVRREEQPEDDNSGLVVLLVFGGLILVIAIGAAISAAVSGGSSSGRYGL